MSNPFIPFDPPGDTTNRTPKMLSQLTKPIVNGQPVPPGGGSKLIIPPEDLTFGAQSFLMELYQQPAGVKEYFPHQRRKYNARAYNVIRIGTDRYVAGSDAAKYVVQFTATPLDPASWVGAGRGGAEVGVSLAGTGAVVSEYLFLHNSARVDVYWRVIGKGGDGVASPVTGIVYVQFDIAEEPLYEKIYWRNLVPSAQPPAYSGPSYDLLSTEAEQIAFTGLRPIAWYDPGETVERYLTPTDATVIAGARQLNPNKASGDLGAISLAGTANDAHISIYGGLGRFVGRPLMAQVIPAFYYEHWYASTAPSADTDGAGNNHLWVWRPGVGRILISDGLYAESWDGGPDQKYVRYISRQVRNWGYFPGFTAALGDRFVLDHSGANNILGGGFSTTAGLTLWTHYNGTVEPYDPEGFADGFTGVAAYTSIPKFKYSGE